MAEARSIRLALLTPEALQALAVGDLATAGAIARLPLTDYFATDDLLWLWDYRVKQIAADPASADWIVRAVVSEPDGQVVGHAGFHGPPDDNGLVEVGYSVDPLFRKRGYAKAIVRALLERAYADPAVTTVRASIAPTNVASLATIAGFGFAEVGEQWDERDGLELLFDLATHTKE